MIFHIVRATLLLSFFWVAGCASSGGVNAEPSGDPNLITAEQIQGAFATTAYQVVQALHPEWLRKRGNQSLNGASDIAVYFDNARMGGPEALNRIPAATITYMQFFDARAAQYRWGAGHTHGVIFVSAQEK